MTLAHFPDKSAVKSFHRKLYQWYSRNGRVSLPWRLTSDPYAIWISEIMLQQTQVKTVLERYYQPFLTRFPTLSALAKAKREDVLSAWQGLGYYNRAANLHEAAKRCGNFLPKTVDELIALPGIGKNTAHAVAAFAYRHPVPVMEANVKRVLSRIFALSQPDDATLWDTAHGLLDSKNPFDYNQAMMDIGSMVCLRRAPECGICPASSICKGKDSPESYPAAIAKKKPPVRSKQIILFRNGSGAYFAEPRQSRFLQGLYHFVETPADAKNVEFQKRQYELARARSLGQIRQQYSHFTLEGTVRLIETPGSRGKSWYSLKQLEKLPVSMAEQKILALLAAEKM